MIDERDLREALHRRAAAVSALPADPAGVARRARWRIVRSTLTVVVVLIAGTMATTAAIRERGDRVPIHQPPPTSTASPTPSPFDAKALVGFSMFPGEGAVPSHPKVGDLVATFIVERDGEARDAERYLAHSIRYYVYADGRLIWQIGEATDAATGWLEQRLTLEGVDLLREQDGEEWKVPDPAAWITGVLPPAAWADPQIRAYVPARFVAELNFVGAGERTPEDPSVLNPPADRLLREADHVDRGGTCEMVTLEEALDISTGFDAANEASGNGHVPPDSMPVIGVGFAWASLVPAMPHETACSL